MEDNKNKIVFNIDEAKRMIEKRREGLDLIRFKDVRIHLYFLKLGFQPYDITIEKDRETGELGLTYYYLRSYTNKYYTEFIKLKKERKI